MFISGKNGFFIKLRFDTYPFIYNFLTLLNFHILTRTRYNECHICVDFLVFAIYKNSVNK